MHDSISIKFVEELFFAVDKLSVVTTIKRLLAYLSTLETWDIWFKSRSHIPLSIVGQGVKTLPFHGSSTGSNPVRCIVDISTFTAALSTAENGFFTVQSFLSDFSQLLQVKVELMETYSSLAEEDALEMR